MLPVGLALVLVGRAPARAASCENLALSFLDTLSEPSLTLEAQEPSLRVAGRMVSVDGARLMESRYWNVRYRVIPHGTADRGITGESYWAVETKSRVLEVEFQRDAGGRITREILRVPPPSDSPASDIPWPIVGWYHYLRNDQGQLVRLVYHAPVGQVGSSPSEDDPVQSLVELDYGLGGRNPRAATIYGAIWRGASGATASVRFDYDSAGRLTGGVRQGIWQSEFRVTGACDTVPERIFVVLLASHGGPWNPFVTTRYGMRPNGPR